MTKSCARNNLMGATEIPVRQMFDGRTRSYVATRPQEWPDINITNVNIYARHQARHGIVPRAKLGAARHCEIAIH